MREKPHDYFLGAPAAAVCHCKPSYGNRVLVDRVSPRERRTRTNRGVCPECLRPMKLTRIDTLHRGCEICDVDRALQRSGQLCVADIHDHAGTHIAHVRRGAFPVETQDQLAGTAVAALEVDGRNGNGVGRTLGRISRRADS